MKEKEINNEVVKQIVKQMEQAVKCEKCGSRVNLINIKKKNKKNKVMKLKTNATYLCKKCVIEEIDKLQ